MKLFPYVFSFLKELPSADIDLLPWVKDINKSITELELDPSLVISKELEDSFLVVSKTKSGNKSSST